MPLENGATISGTVNVGMSVLDASSDTAIDAEKKMVVSSANAIADGYVIFMSGTVGTTAIELSSIPAENGYRNSNGEIPFTRDLAHVKGSFVAFSAEPEAVVKWSREIIDPQDYCRLVSVDGSASISSGYGGPPPAGLSRSPTFTVSLIPGTTVTSATYTIMSVRSI